MDGRADGYLPRDPRSGAIGPDTSAVVYAMLPGWWVGSRRCSRVARYLLAPVIAGKNASPGRLELLCSIRIFLLRRKTLEPF